MATFFKDEDSILVRDQNRFRKIYRYVRKKPRPLNCPGGNISSFAWGCYFVDFNYQNEVEHSFPCCFKDVPAVVATTVSRELDAGTAAKISFLNYGEDVTANGYNASTPVIGDISVAKRNEIEREWIDLKNKDNTIYRIEFKDGIDDTQTPSADQRPHQSYVPGYTPDHTTVVDISNVVHWGVGEKTQSTGGVASSVTYKFRVASQGIDLNYSTSLATTFPEGTGTVTLAQLLNNLWWDFKNKDNSIWRIRLSAAEPPAPSMLALISNGYPTRHTNPGYAARDPQVDKFFNIPVANTITTLGEWITNLITQINLVSSGGETFGSKWSVTTTNSPAAITFTAQPGNKGLIAPLTDPTPNSGTASLNWVDTHEYAVKTDTAPTREAVTAQTAFTNGSGGETNTLGIGLMQAIRDTVNGDYIFNQKWNASTSVNSVERAAGSSSFFESFVLTFTATSDNLGVIANIADPGAGSDPGTFYYYFGDYIATNGVLPGDNQLPIFFDLTSASQYRNEKYPDLNQNPPNPLPVLVSNGASTGGKISTNPNYNVFVTDITKSSCIFRTSGNFTGYVYYQALIDGVYTMPNIGRSLEVKTLTFDGTNDFVTYTFTADFSCDPIVTVTADEDVNAFVTSLSKTSVTVEVSKAGYEGKVYLQAIEKGC